MDRWIEAGFTFPQFACDSFPFHLLLLPAQNFTCATLEAFAFIVLRILAPNDGSSSHFILYDGPHHNLFFSSKLVRNIFCHKKKYEKVMEKIRMKRDCKHVDLKCCYVGTKSAAERV